ncbi:hypothetical protein ACF0H5_016342 [Mactra antiquata]
MADVDLQDRILNFLEGKPKKSDTTAKLVNFFRIPKKSLNIQLYSLQKKGRIVKLNESPPAWGLSDQNFQKVDDNGDVSASGQSNLRPRRLTRNTVHDSPECDGNNEKVIEFLQRQQNPVRPGVIAKGIGYSKAAEVNKILYSLQQKGIIMKKTEKPPTWQLTDTYLHGASGGHDDLKVENISTIDTESFSPGQNVYDAFQPSIPNFQETELFSSQDMEDSVSQPDSETVDSPGTYAGQEDNSRDSNTLENDNGSENSQPVETNMLFENESEYGLPGNHGDRREGIAVNSNVNAVFDEDQSNSDVRGEIENSEDLLNDEHMDTKPKTFRDFFNLDDSMSHGSKSSLDSIGNTEAVVKVESNTESVMNEGLDETSTWGSKNELVQNSSIKSEIESQVKKSLERITSPGPVLTFDTAQASIFSETGEFVPYELDLGDNIDELSDNVSKENTESGNSMENKKSGDSMENENFDNMENEETCTNVEEEDKNEEMMAVETEESEDTDNVETDNGDMENCDKVLKILFDMKFAAQFILKKKTGINDDDEFERVITKCVSLNYLTGSSKLWKITPAGIEYGQKKFDEASNVQKSIDQIQPSGKVKQNFKGPPPPPMTLLNKQKGGTSYESKGISNSKSQPQSSSQISPSLFKVSSCSSAPVIKNTGNDFNSKNESHPQSGPPSLLSLKFDNIGLSSKKTMNDSIFRSQNKPVNSVQEPLFNQTVNETNDLFPSKQPPSLLSGTKLQESSSSSNSKTFKASSSIQAQKYSPYSSNDKKSNTPTIENKTRVIPDKYANYPNLSACPLDFKGQKRKRSADRAGASGISNSAFKSGPPPSPMDILSKNLRKTEISPPSSYKDGQPITSQSGSFSRLPQTCSSNTFSSTPKNLFSNSNVVFSQASLTQNSPMAVAKQSVTVNQSSFKQSGSTYSNSSSFESLPTSLPSRKSEQISNQSVNKTRQGPPPPPAVKLGIQTVQTQQPMSLPVPSQHSYPIHSQQPVHSPGNSKLGLALSSESFAALNKNPVSALMEYAQSRKMQARVEVVGQRGSSHKPTFEMAAFVGKRRFPPITCHNKKDGRKEACDIALRQLIAEGQFQAEKESSAGNMSSLSAVPSTNMTHFDTIAALTHRGFTALVSQITTESFAGRKVIAGLVMKRSPDDTGVLISLGTGNRCITGQQLSLQGNTVNDSHAEIITRRGFLRFLYKQLMEYDPSKHNPLFEKSPNGKIQVRSNITFHLYISTAPCGDGALFSPRDAESSKTPVDTRIRPPHEPTFSSNVQGVLRTKVEGGEGTIPIEAGFKGQTFDGIQRGERLRTMSCTDKICRWNVVGMQGALLSHFLEPIYLDSLTLGLLYEHGHLSRAVCCRLGRGDPDINTMLPNNYKLNHPWLGRVTVCDPPREVQKTKALSINWCFGDKVPEVTDGTLGLCYTSIEKGFFSRCSKRNMFTQFRFICEKFGRQDLLNVSSYNEAKMAAEDFVAAKETMLKKFKANGYGKWVSKPVEEEMFGFEEN